MARQDGSQDAGAALTSKESNIMQPSERRSFSMRTLFALIGVSAVTTLALANASIYWGALFFSAAILIVAFAFLGAVFRRGTQRAWWIGFACFGAGYLVMTYAPGFDLHVGHRLISTKVLGFLEPKIRRTPDPLKNVFRSTPPEDATKPAREAVMQISKGEYLPQWGHFQQVGHSLSAILMALLGGRAAAWFSRTNVGSNESQGRDTN